MSDDPNSLSQIAAQLTGLERSMSELTDINRAILAELKSDREGARVVNQAIFTRLGELHEMLTTLERGTSEGYKSIDEQLGSIRKEVTRNGARQHELEQSVDELAAAERERPKVASQAPGDR
jgi:hypothetical protein